MKARILLTVTAARPHCAAAAPLLSMFLPHRRFQSSKSKSQFNASSSSPPSSSPSSSSQNDPPNKQPISNPATLKSLLGDLLVDSPSPSINKNNNFNYNNYNGNYSNNSNNSNNNSASNPLLSSYSLPASFSSRNRHSPSPPNSSPHSLLSKLGLTGTGTSFFDQTLSELPLTDQTTGRIPRMGPTAGRSVLVQGDVTVAFTRLKSVVQANRVRSDMMKQRFHERPGLKKKRLKRERHRRRFKEAFKRMVGVVLDMKNRGM